MLGFDAIVNTKVPPRSQTLAVFATMGFMHHCILNLLVNDPFYHKPLRGLYRIGLACYIGLIVDHVAPMYKKRALMKAEFEEKMRAWREGVVKRREMERELLLGR